MKILSLEFENINNLRGPQRIPFDELPLSEAGLFAITGPTGSGKSTILDVITLALFNRIPRFRNKISKNELINTGSVVTHHTDHASASITYSIKGHVFTSTWSIRKARTGNFKDYEMFLYDEAGQPFDLKKGEIPAKNEEIIGLKYDQFVKAIILSQGQFAKFLKADKNERGQLLENLTGTHIYRKIGIAIYEKYKKVKQEIAIEKDRLEHITVLTDEERKEKHVTIKLQLENKIKRDKSIAVLQEVKQVKTEVESLLEKKKKKALENSQLKQKIAEFQPRLKSLEIYEKAIPYRGDIALYKEALSLQEKLEKEISLQEENLNKAKNGIVTVLNGMSELTSESVSEENFKEVMSTFEKEVINLDQKMGHLAEKGKESRNRINEMLQNAQFGIGKKENPEVAIELLTNHHERFLKVIAEAGVFKDADKRELKSAIDGFKKEISFYEKMMTITKQITELEKSIGISQNTLQTEKSKLDKQLPLVAKNEELLTTNKALVDALKKQKQDALLIADLEDHRSRLVDGEPCPLCGSALHPYSAHAPDSSLTQLEEKIENTQSVINDLQSIIKKAHIDISALKTTIKMLHEKVEKDESLLQNEMQQKAELTNSHKKIINLTQDEMAVNINANTEKVKLFEDAIEAIDGVVLAKNLIAEFQGLQGILQTHQESAKARKSMYAGNYVSHDCNKLQDQFTLHQTNIHTISADLKKDRSNHKSAKAQSESILVSIKSQIEKLGYNSIDELTQNLISEDEYSNIKNQQENFTKHSTSLETETKSLEEALQNYFNKDSMPETTLNEVVQSLSEMIEQRDVLTTQIGELQAILKRDDDDRIQKSSKASVIEALNKKMEKWALLNNMIGDAQGAKFANYAQGLTLQNLLVYANKRLVNLTDRYLLDKPQNDDALSVVDQYQGNIHRAVSTLSGGESFLVSLALALSLSDMASKNVKLESLFIDEGFGTLDQDTLDVAMDTLEKLQSDSNKMVGIISHVEALKERINVQIKLQKNAQGYSDIKIEG